MREFVSGPPSYRFIYERVRDRKPNLRKGSLTNSLMTKWSMSGVSLNPCVCACHAYVCIYHAYVHTYRRSLTRLIGRGTEKESGEEERKEE